MDGFIMLKACGSNLLPTTGICGECFIEFVFVTSGSAMQFISCNGRGTVKGMRKSLMLEWSRSYRGGNRKICALEVGGGEVSDAVANSGRELSDGLLDLDRIVIGFAFVCFRSSKTPARNSRNMNVTILLE